MILYILRFSFSLALVYGFYRLVLEKEKSFVFNRFFLLFGLLISLIVPVFSFSGSDDIKTVITNTQQIVYQDIIAWEDLFNRAYILIAFILLLRFSIDCLKLWRNVKKGNSKIVKGTKVILTNQKLPPYSFLQYIFINGNSFDQIEPELIEHEIAHIKQGHTLDILFIELVKAFIWINPMLSLFKKSMRLNHEFLADESAIKNSASISDYQNILLSYFKEKDTPVIASGFNFSLTKKRFIMMTKRKSKSQFARQVLVLPLLVLILLACSDTTGVGGKEMLKYWRYTANMEEILRTGKMNEEDLKKGIVLPIVSRAQYDELQDIYTRMNTSQKQSVYELPPYLERIKTKAVE